MPTGQLVRLYRIERKPPFSRLHGDPAQRGSGSWPEGKTTMSEYPAPLWRDPLFSPGDRFPLGPPRGIMDNCHEGPSGSETRPFSLRHVVAGARLDTPPTWRYTYCHERQIALVHDEDGSLIPLLKHTQPGATPSPGTSVTPDGQPGKSPPEEMLAPDHQSD